MKMMNHGLDSGLVRVKERRYNKPMNDHETMPFEGATAALAALFQSNPETAFDYLEFRRLIAGSVAAFAAERADDAARNAIRACLAAIETAHTADDPTAEARADADFHLAIYDAAGNEVLAHIMRAVLGMLHAGVFYDRGDLYQRRGVRDGFLRDHRAIAAAILAGDVTAARAAADAHLAFTRDALRAAQQADRRRDIAVRRRDSLELISRRNNAKPESAS